VAAAQVPVAAQGQEVVLDLEQVQVLVLAVLALRADPVHQAVLALRVDPAHQAVPAHRVDPAHQAVPAHRAEPMFQLRQ
jgi:hypothetical protein